MRMCEGENLNESVRVRECESGKKMKGKERIQKRAKVRVLISKAAVITCSS
jgi:hypothetical protein